MAMGNNETDNNDDFEDPILDWQESPEDRPIAPGRKVADRDIQTVVLGILAGAWLTVADFLSP